MSTNAISSNLEVNDQENRNKELRLTDSNKSLILKWLKSSSIHGLPRIMDSRRCYFKIMWAIVFICSTSYMVWSVLRLVKDYHEYPSYISTSIIRETPTNFPAITFYNNRIIHKERYCQLNKDSSICPTSSRYYDHDNDICDGKVIADVYRNKSNFFQLQDMLLFCSYNDKECTVKDFTLEETNYGYFFIFNQGKYVNGSSYDIKTSRSQIESGLILELYLGNPSKDTDCLINNGGFQISIQNQSCTFAKVNEQTYLAEGGTDVTITISRNFIYKLGQPYGNCTKDVSRNSTFHSKLFDYIIYTVDIPYKEIYCLLVCKQEELIRQCNCSSDMIIGNSPSFDKVDFCDKNATNNECMRKFQENYDTDSWHCRNECPLECDSVKYDVKSYVTSYPTNYYWHDELKYWANKKKINLMGDDYSKSFVRLNLKYENMEYTITEQKISVTLNQLIANIVGFLGLCIGVTILSAFEVSELIFDLIMLPIRKKKENKLFVR